MLFLTLSGSAEIINALNNLVQALVNNFGAWGTIGIAVALVVITGVWKIYNIRRKDRETNLALKEKDRTIQRLAEQERNYRILFFKEKCGWTDEQVLLFVMRNEFEDVPSARRELEGERVQVKAAAQARNRRGKRK
jgi:hypothetical protein